MESLDLLVLKNKGTKSGHYKMSTKVTGHTEFSEIYPILPLVFPPEKLQQIEEELIHNAHDLSETLSILKRHYQKDITTNRKGIADICHLIESEIFAKRGITRTRITDTEQGNGILINYEKNQDVRFVEARVKSIDGFLTKYTLETYREPPKAIKDVNGIRIITNQNTGKIGTNLCYTLLGEILTKFKPITKDGNIYIKDFFQKPEVRQIGRKKDYYKGIHAYIFHNDKFYEIQIRPKNIHYKSQDPNNPLFHENFKEKKLSEFK